jgi:ubiquinone/menaquinone biosynthesis C-methylase UbiE
MAIRDTVERMAVSPHDLHYREHVARYKMALDYVVSGPHLDLASGTGYGSDLLQARCASLVVGIDIDRPALTAARRAFPNPRIAFLSASGTAIPFANGTFASVTSMETIEHITDDRAFVSELARVVRPGGVCIISTPNRLYSTAHDITNPFHVREYAEAELTALLSGFFPSVRVFYQGFQSSYHATVESYGAAIQTQKAQLNPALRWAIDRVYRPAKALIPASVSNFFIRRLLRLSFPQPAAADITISPEPVRDCSNFVVVCRK